MQSLKARKTLKYNDENDISKPSGFDDLPFSNLRKTLPKPARTTKTLGMTKISNTSTETRTKADNGEFLSIIFRLEYLYYILH